MSYADCKTYADFRMHLVSSYEEIAGASRHSFSSFTPAKGMPPLIAGRKSNAGDNLCALSFSCRKQDYADTERLESLLFLRL